MWEAVFKYRVRGFHSLAWHSHPYGKSKVLSQNRIELAPGFIRVNAHKFIIYQPFFT